MIERSGNWFQAPNGARIQNNSILQAELQRYGRKAGQAAATALLEDILIFSEKGDKIILQERPIVNKIGVESSIPNVLVKTRDGYNLVPWLKHKKPLLEDLKDAISDFCDRRGLYKSNVRNRGGFLGTLARIARRLVR